MSDIDNPEVLLAVLDSLTVGVSLVDRQGKIVLWNRRAERLTGTSAAVVYYLAGSRGRAVPAREPAPSESAIF